ncbi:hypothetical protein [Nakamurella lactea]|uniref:hypothetical protein n=1 Tax=Nakamurella lactea TaxID=459515 RepID=UPI00041D1EA1|nr:hypothetical protein [Nakamurella lactea]
MDLQIGNGVLSFPIPADPYFVDVTRCDDGEWLIGMKDVRIHGTDETVERLVFEAICQIVDAHGRNAVERMVHEAIAKTYARQAVAS